jgi:basic membrane lipoprotein Med (substrate-binding protein (PBP1-ABC) superfamily)
VALITPGSVTDAAWNSGAYAGLNAIKDSLKVEVSNVEAHTPVEQQEALRTYAAEGYTLVFCHGFEFQDAAERVSAEFPATTFIVTSGQRVSGNVSPLIFRLHEASYLAGIVAGGLTKSGTIGFIGGIELPPIKEAEDAWVDGAKSINPRIVARSTYLNSFNDVAAGREATIALIHVGADMLHHNADAAALGMFQAVKETPGVYAFGANANQATLAPGHVLGSAVIDLPRAFLSVAKEVKNGAFRPRVESFGLKSGVIRYEPGPGVNLPPAVQGRLTFAADSIVGRDSAGP